MLTDTQELERQIRARGYTEVMYDLQTIVKRLERENFVGLFYYWRQQAEGIHDLIER